MHGRLLFDVGLERERDGSHGTHGRAELGALQDVEKKDDLQRKSGPCMVGQQRHVCHCPKEHPLPHHLRLHLCSLSLCPLFHRHRLLLLLLLTHSLFTHSLFTHSLLIHSLFIHSLLIHSLPIHSLLHSLIRRTDIGIIFVITTVITTIPSPPPPPSTAPPPPPPPALPLHPAALGHLLLPALHPLLALPPVCLPLLSPRLKNIRLKRWTCQDAFHRRLCFSSSSSS